MSNAIAIKHQNLPTLDKLAPVLSELSNLYPIIDYENRGGIYRPEHVEIPPDVVKSYVHQPGAVAKKLYDEMASKIIVYRQLAIEIGEGLFTMDRLGLWEFFGASSLYDLYQKHLREGDDPPFAIGYQQAAKLRQIFWSLLRLQLQTGDETIFEIAQEVTNKDKLQTLSSVITQHNYKPWLEVALDQDTSLTEVKRLASAARQLSMTGLYKTSDLLPDLVRELADSKEIPIKQSYTIQDIRNPQQTANQLIEACSREDLEIIVKMILASLD